MARARILIVDDDAFVRKALRRALSTYELVLAEDGEQAIEILDTAGGFDLILCDMMMPRVSGLELYEHVRQRWPGQEAHMVFLTGGAVTDHADARVSELRNPVIEKPFEYQRLRGLIEEMLARQASSS